MSASKATIQAIEKELLVALRGRRSQSALSKLLGYSYNQVYRWEAGRSLLGWRDFIRLALVNKRDPERIF